MNRRRQASGVRRKASGVMYWENYDVRVRMDGKIDQLVLQDIPAKRK